MDHRIPRITASLTCFHASDFCHLFFGHRRYLTLNDGRNASTRRLDGHPESILAGLVKPAEQPARLGLHLGKRSRRGELQPLDEPHCPGRWGHCRNTLDCLTDVITACEPCKQLTKILVELLRLCEHLSKPCRHLPHGALGVC